MKHLALGASLYIPATRRDLLPLANGVKHGELRSMIFCTEDAIDTADLEWALGNLRACLPHLEPRSALRFVRPRNPYVLARVLEMPGAENLDGFVLPKVSPESISHYLELFSSRDRFLIMPTLETVHVFDGGAMDALRDILLQPAVRARVLALRIGGNDLLHLVGVRRSQRRTIYESPLGPQIARLVTQFVPHGLPLTAPVFEGLNDPELLMEEVERDLEHGLIGKTAIHPDQIPIIEGLYQVSAEESEMASAILRDGAPAVFRMHDTMCEVATHHRWAETVVMRERLYGRRGAPVYTEREPVSAAFQ